MMGEESPVIASGAVVGCGRPVEKVSKRVETFARKFRWQAHDKITRCTRLDVLNGAVLLAT